MNEFEYLLKAYYNEYFVFIFVLFCIIRYSRYLYLVMMKILYKFRFAKCDNWNILYSIIYYYIYVNNKMIECSRYCSYAVKESIIVKMCFDGNRLSFAHNMSSSTASREVKDDWERQSILRRWKIICKIEQFEHDNLLSSDSCKTQHTCPVASYKYTALMRTIREY